MNDVNSSADPPFVQVYFDKGKLKYFDGNRLISYDGRSDTAKVESMADQCKVAMRWIFGLFFFVAAMVLIATVGTAIMNFKPQTFSWWFDIAPPLGICIFFIIGIITGMGKVDNVIEARLRTNSDVSAATMKKLREIYAQGPKGSQLTFKQTPFTFVKQFVAVLVFLLFAGVFLLLPGMAALGPIVTMQLKNADKEYLAGNYAQAEKTYKWVFPLIDRLPIQIASQDQHDNVPYMWDRMAEIAAANGRMDEAKHLAKASLGLHVNRFTSDPEDSDHSHIYNQYSEGGDVVHCATNYCELLAATNQLQDAEKLQMELWPTILPYLQKSKSLVKYEKNLLQYVSGGLYHRGFKSESDQLDEQIRAAEALPQEQREARYMQLLRSQKPMWRAGQPVKLVPRVLW